MDDKKKVIYFGSDKESYEVKRDMTDFLKGKGYDIVDLGVFKEDEIAYDRIDREVREKVQEREDALGVLLFGKKEEVKEEVKGEKKK